ncbi:LytR C-terminal domain-containing protein [Nocardia sp. NBC_00403]|uniref:LytR C-terminal domain-containing protein n=1 Tax=Nocardia sp. NBC_00403 TaxID=2975990 RepID=UPI002E21DC63
MSYPNPTSGGPPLRALAMVLIALAIVFAGLGAMSLSSSDTDSAGESEAVSPASQVQATSVVVRTSAATSTSEAATTTVTPTTTKPPTTTTPPTTTPALGRAVPVRVLNNGLIAGLASRTASELSASGWNVVEVGNYPGENVAKTTVFYGNTPGEREAAVAIAAELGATAVPRSTGAGDSGSGVTVVVTGN